LFTGIIEELGRLSAFRQGPRGAKLEIEAPGIAAGLKRGDSVSVSGVCLTASESGGRTFACDLSAETLARSSFRQAREGVFVNLERALQVGSRLGGHIVLGHVDEVGRLISSIASGEGWTMEFYFPPELERYLVYKGSIAVDGISLTIAALARQSFKVAVIPHTYDSTNLRFLRPGHTVNLEADIIGKYMDRFFQLGLSPGQSKRSSIGALWQEDS